MHTEAVKRGIVMAGPSGTLDARVYTISKGLQGHNRGYNHKLGAVTIGEA
jgi:hypothetical protein